MAIHIGATYPQISWMPLLINFTKFIQRASHLLAYFWLFLFIILFYVYEYFNSVLKDKAMKLKYSRTYNFYNNLIIKNLQTIILLYFNL